MKNKRDRKEKNDRGRKPEEVSVEYHHLAL